MEGNLGELTLTGAKGLNEGFLNKLASYRLNGKHPLNESNLVRNVTLMNALPALQANAQLDPGQAVGSSNVGIDIEQLPKWSGFLQANTYGNRFTKREVFSAGVIRNNPMGKGDQLFLNLKTARDAGQRGVFVAYTTPIHASGTLLSASYNYLDYKLGGKF